MEPLFPPTNPIDIPFPILANLPTRISLSKEDIPCLFNALFFLADILLSSIGAVLATTLFPILLSNAVKDIKQLSYVFVCIQ